MVSVLSQRQLNVTSLDDTSLTGTIDAGDGGFMLLTIAYTEGFSLEVDGEPCELLSVGDALCGVALGPGSHDVKLEYVPAGFTQSAFISAAGIVALGAVLLVQKLTARDAKKVTVVEEEVAQDEKKD